MDQDSQKRLAMVVKTARGSLSQRAFAEKLGVGHGTIQRWEKGEGSLTLDNLEKLADYCQQTPETLTAHLYGRTVQPPSRSEVLDSLSPQELSRILQMSAQRLRELTQDSA